MNKGFADSHRSLLWVLWFLFESLLIAAVVTAFWMDNHRRSSLDDAAGLTFWFALIGLFTVSFILRRVCRYLAIIWMDIAFHRILVARSSPDCLIYDRR